MPIRYTHACAIGLLLISLSLQAQTAGFTHFLRADSIAISLEGHSLSDLRLLSEKLTKDLHSDIEKYRAIYLWVCSNIENDYRLYQMQRVGVERFKNRPEKYKLWTKKFSCEVFQKLLNEKKTLCTGYAYLMHELAYQAGLVTELIHGYGRTAKSNIAGDGRANHSWNAVFLENRWYMTDPTWSSGYINRQKGKFIKQFDDSYFLVKPEYFVLNHYPLDTAQIHAAVSPTLQEFLIRPIVYKSTIAQRILPNFPNTLFVKTRKGEELSIQFTSEKQIALNDIVLIIANNGKAQKVTPKALSQIMQSYQINHVFLRRGNFVVTVYSEGNPILTYSVQVTK